ncbi:MAG: TlpA disulfide reductase family protein [Roseiarcus sp.]|jgi:thiol-disulfide isomerase/thioredoxin
MSENDKRNRRIGAAGGAVALAALGTLGVLYGKAPAPGKADADCPASSAQLSARLAPLARGEIAALAVEMNPRPEARITFDGPEGAKLTLADFRGRAVLLNLWANWCVPCRAEMPALDRLQAKAGAKDFQVVAVNVDTTRLERRDAFLDGLGVKALTRYADPSGDALDAMRAAGKALGLPTTLLIDAAGCELGAVAGAVKWDSPDALKLVEALKGG